MVQNVQGIISKSVNNALTQFESLGYLSSNAANYNNSGYKSVRFENYLNPYGRVHGYARRSFEQGAVYRTNNPMDVAINGAGFIPVTSKNGAVAYTRNGSFAVNKEGMLVTNDGSIVGDGIKIPANYYRMSIKKDGTVAVITQVDAKEQVLGKIPIVNFNNPEGLDLGDGNKFVQTEDSGEPVLVKDHDFLVQGSVERSNVDLHATVSEVMQLNASLIASTRLIKVTDDIYRQSINLRQ